MGFWAGLGRWHGLGLQQQGFKPILSHAGLVNPCFGWHGLGLGFRCVAGP